MINTSQKDIDKAVKIVLDFYNGKEYFTRKESTAVLLNKESNPVHLFEAHLKVVEKCFRNEENHVCYRYLNSVKTL